MTAALTVADLARLFRVTEKTVLVWIKAGMPVAKAGAQGRGKKTQLELEKCVEWFFLTNFERLELDRSRTRLANEQADKAALENAKTRGDLVSLALIGREFGNLLTELRTNALAIPSKLAPELEGQTIAERKATLDRAIFDLLDRAVAWRPSLAAGTDSRGIEAPADLPAAAAGRDGQSMGGRAANPKRRGGRRAGKVENRKG